VEISGKPLLDTELDAPLFVGREDVLDVLTRSVENTTNVLMLGSRGSGRTSTLRLAARRQREHGWRTIFVAGSLATDAREFLSLLRHQVSGTYDPTSDVDRIAFAELLMRESARERVSAFGSPATLLELVASVERMLEVLDLPTALFVDELASPELAHVLFGRLRDELWKLPVSWVVAGSSSDRATYLAPPADAFFPRVVELGPLDLTTSFELLRRRIPKRKASDAALFRVAAAAGGNPRFLVHLAHDVFVAKVPVEAVSAEAAWREQALRQLGDPARRLAGELEANGPASASDVQLLTRLGWKRSRAAQVFRQLEDGGIVRGSFQRGNGKRPRKVYELVRAPTSA
jgi:hypothetical protein